MRTMRSLSSPIGSIAEAVSTLALVADNVSTAQVIHLKTSLETRLVAQCVKNAASYAMKKDAGQRITHRKNRELQEALGR